MDNLERTPLLLHREEAVANHHQQQQQQQQQHVEANHVTEDQVDGVLFNTCPVPNGRATPDLINTWAPPPHLYSPPPNPPCPGVPQTKVFLRRFWILGAFSFMAMFQCLMWNTWGPVSASVDAAFPGWGSGTVAMMSNWGTITFVMFVVPMCWLMQAKGLRAGVLVCGGLIAAGTVLRAVPLLFSEDVNVTFFTVMCHACAILVGTAGTLVMAAPPMIAAVWFPPRERTTATAFAQMLNQLGNAGSYLEPLLVSEPSPHPAPPEVTLIQNEIKRLMYIWAAVGMVMMVALVMYFPSRPPSPPSITSHVERLNFRESVRMMCRNRDLLLVTVSYGLSLGVPSAWASVLNYSLYELNMTQDEAMWVGVASTLISGAASLVVGKFTDVFYGHIKLSLIVALTCNLAFFYWFFLLTWGAIPVSTWQIYASVVGGMSFNFSLSPVFFELAVESSYPCSEVLVGGLLTAANNLVGVCFLFLFLLPFQSYQWVTYVLLTTLGLAVVPLVVVEEDYHRSNIDRSPPPISAYQPI